MTRLYSLTLRTVLYVNRYNDRRKLKKTLTAKRVAYWTEISHLLTIMASSWSVYTVGASMKAVAPVPSDWTGNTDEAVPDDAVVAK